MKITILNGSPQRGSLDVYLDGLVQALRAAGHNVDPLELRSLNLKYCVGCWGCWVKTPGECLANDDSERLGRAVINADFVLWASPLRMGFPSELFKRALDKHLALIHPYIVVDQGEAHHLNRYPRSPRVGLLLEKEASSDARDLQIVTDIHCRTALNFKTRLEFAQTTDDPLEALVQRITNASPTQLPMPARLKPTSGVSIPPPQYLTFFNGSPRGSKGNTPIFLREIAAGAGIPHQMFHLSPQPEAVSLFEAFANAECVILGFPLYTDSMPGLVKRFIETLEPLVGRANNPALGFVVQSGFPEGLHSRFVERYLEKLAQRLGSRYLGTVVKGNGEAVRQMPPEANRGLFAQLQALGAGLASAGSLDPKIAAKISQPERFPAIMMPILQIFLRLPISHFYFDGMLKKNGAFSKRFARPYWEPRPPD